MEREEKTILKGKPVFPMALIFLFLSFSAVMTVSGADKTVTMRVKAGGGLRMRSGPGTSYHKREVIPDGSRITVLERKGKSLIIAGKKGKWTRISWKGKTGWVFGGFLVGEEPTAKEMDSLPREWFPAGFPAKWAKLSNRNGEEVIMKFCFALNPQIYLESGKRKIVFMLGQESEIYTIGSVRKVPGGFDYTVIDTSGYKKQYSFRWITEGKTGRWGSDKFVASEFSSGYRIISEMNGNCGNP